MVCTSGSSSIPSGVPGGTLLQCRWICLQRHCALLHRPNWVNSVFKCETNNMEIRLCIVCDKRFWENQWWSGLLLDLKPQAWYLYCNTLCSNPNLFPPWAQTVGAWGHQPPGRDSQRAIQRWGHSWYIQLHGKEWKPWGDGTTLCGHPVSTLHVCMGFPASFQSPTAKKQIGLGIWIGRRCNVTASIDVCLVSIWPCNKLATCPWCNLDTA